LIAYTVKTALRAVSFFFCSMKEERKNI